MKVCEQCGDKFTRQDTLTRHINTICEAPDSWDQCPSCKKYYKELGKHYFYNDDHRPNISDEQHKIIFGCFLGDGFICRSSSNPRLRISMINKEYIKYLEKKLNPLSKNIFEVLIEENNNQQQYELYTITHPELNKYANCYSSGEKIYPSNIELSSLSLKHWYIQDGHLQTGRYPTIRCWNERNRTEKVKKYFKNTPLNCSFSSGTIRFPSSKDDFFEYIGEPLPGFERKWPANVE